MKTTVSCPSCSRTLLVPEELQGKSVRCPTCETVFTAYVERPQEGPVPPTSQEPDVSEHLSAGTSGPPPERERQALRPGEQWEDDDEEYYDGPEYGRGFRGRSRPAAFAAVSGPATALQVTGWISLALSILGICANVFRAFADPGRARQNQQLEVMVNGATGLMSGISGIVLAILIIIGAGKMKRLENYGLAMASSIIAMLPCTLCCILGLPFGIWSLVVLNRPEVKESFR